MEQAVGGVLVVDAERALGEAAELQSAGVAVGRADRQDDLAAAARLTDRDWGGATTALGWKGPWMPTPALAVAGNGTVGLVATVPVGEGRARTDLVHSHDCGATWERASMTSRFAVGRAPGEGSGLGLAHQLVGLPHGFATAVVQGAPAAVRGSTDVFSIEAHLGPRGRC